MHEARTANSQDTLLPLFELVQRGDQNAFAGLYDRTSSRLFGVAMGILSNEADAEDVLSEVYQQVWRRASSYDTTRGSVLTWMVVICRSRALDAIRRRRVALDADSEIPELAMDDVAIDQLELSELTHQGLASGMQALSEDQRQLLSMAFFRGLTHQEIAEATDTPLGTVKSHIRRGLASLRDHLSRTALRPT